jgi:hypothetical protein
MFFFIDIWRDHSPRHVDLSFLHGPDSEDISFDKPQLEKNNGRLIWSTCGKTKTLEDPEYQHEASQVCAFWTYVPTHLIVPRQGRILYTFVLTLDSKKDVALKELKDGK